MVAFVLVSVPIMFTSTIFQTGALVILDRAENFTMISPKQISELVTLFLHLSIMSVYTVDIFWGLWLFPLAYLVYKSNFFPKLIAFALVISDIGYVLDSIS